MENLTDTMRATLGHLRLRGLRETRFRGEDEQPTDHVDMFPPGAVVGRGDEADVSVLDESGFVSRRHVLIESEGLHWVLSDHSSHGTRLQGRGKRVDLLPRVSYPLETGDEVILAGQAGFSVEVRVKAASGVRTKDPVPQKDHAYIEDPALQKLAYLLLGPRRASLGSTAVPSMEDLAKELQLETPAIGHYVQQLRAIDSIGRRLPADGRVSLNDVASAVASAYPYLARPFHEGPMVGMHRAVTTNLDDPRRDVFISHATEDKEAIARPLAAEMTRRGLSIWFDEYELVIGDSLREKIDSGLKHSRIGVVILSRAFFNKSWTGWELNGLVGRLMAGEKNVVAPVWHGVTAEEVRSYSPPLADLVAARSVDGVPMIVDRIQRILTSGSGGQAPAVNARAKRPR